MYDSFQLAALVAVVDLGTFDAASKSLHITPSALSQRIRALETQVGQVLVQRARPCRPTSAGEPLVRLGRQIQLLSQEAEQLVVADDNQWTHVPIAVNADSLATWFRPVLTEIATWDSVLLRLQVEDQDHSTTLLRSGEVMAAVTTSSVPVQGCSVRPLGSMRYVAVATPDLIARYPSMGGGFDLTRAPVINFNAKDDLQATVLERAGVTSAVPEHLVPSSADFVAAVRAGLGWAAVPEQKLDDDLERGHLVQLGEALVVDVPLFWQRWRLSSTILDRVSNAVYAAGPRSMHGRVGT